MDTLKKALRWVGSLLFMAAFPVTILVLIRTSNGPSEAKGLPDWFTAPIYAVVDWIGALFA